MGRCAERAGPRRIPSASMSAAQRVLALLVGLSAAAVALRAVSHKARLPYPVVLAVGGILIGLIPGTRVAVVGPDLILLVFVPGLVFQASIFLHLESLRKLVTPVALLATAGVVLTVTGGGALFHVALDLSWSDAFLLAAILAPTDPIAVVSILRSLNAPPMLATLLESESLFNDGTGVALFVALVASIATGAPSVPNVALHFLTSTAGGFVIGLGCGIVAVVALRATNEATLEFLTTLTLAYGAYLVADVLGVSGIVADVTAGLTLVVARRRLHLHGDDLLAFWDLAGFLLNALLFLLIGTAVPSREIVDQAGAVVLGFVALTVVRAAAVYALTAASDPHGRLIAWRSRPFIVWGGLRGALSVALALSIAGHAGVGSRVPTIAYGIVVLSLLAQGASLRPLARFGVAKHRATSDSS